MLILFQIITSTLRVGGMWSIVITMCVCLSTHISQKTHVQVVHDMLLWPWLSLLGFVDDAVFSHRGLVIKGTGFGCGSKQCIATWRSWDSDFPGRHVNYAKPYCFTKEDELYSQFTSVLHDFRSVFELHSGGEVCCHRLSCFDNWVLKTVYIVFSCFICTFMYYNIVLALKSRHKEISTPSFRSQMVDEERKRLGH